jgi:hypothetical protein
LLNGRPEDIAALSNQIGLGVDDQRNSLKQYLANTESIRSGFGGPAADLNDEGAMNCHSNSQVTVVQRGDDQVAGVQQIGNTYDSTITQNVSSMSGILNPA